MGTMNVFQLYYVADMVESALYGVFSLLVVIVVWLLATRRKMPTVHKVMFGASILMWILCTLHIGFLIQRLSLGTTLLWAAQAEVAIATLQFMVSDLILIWRVFAVWGRNYWATVIPAILMVSAAAVRFAVVGNPAQVLAFVSDTSNDIIIANTMLCTALIAGRIWFLQWKTTRLLGGAPSKGNRSVYHGVLMMIIESGALYALSMLIAVIVDKVHSPGIHVILDLTTPLTGILPTLIVLLVHFDLVPGTHASKSYDAALALTTHEFQVASGPTAVESDSNIEATESRRAASTLKTETSDNEMHEKYNGSVV